MCCMCDIANGGNIVTFNKRGDQLNLETGVVTEVNGDEYPAPNFYETIMSMIVDEGITKLELLANGEHQ